MSSYPIAEAYRQYLRSGQDSPLLQRQTHLSRFPAPILKLNNLMAPKTWWDVVLATQQQPQPMSESELKVNLDSAGIWQRRYGLTVAQNPHGIYIYRRQEASAQAQPNVLPQANQTSQANQTPTANQTTPASPTPPTSPTQPASPATFYLHLSRLDWSALCLLVSGYAYWDLVFAQDQSAKTTYQARLAKLAGLDCLQTYFTPEVVQWAITSVQRQLRKYIASFSALNYLEPAQWQAKLETLGELGKLGLDVLTHLQRAKQLAKSQAESRTQELPVYAAWLVGEQVGYTANERSMLGAWLGHAEIHALAQANATHGAEKVPPAGLDGSETATLSNAPPLQLYVNLEPCLMCAGACLSARTKRVVFTLKSKRTAGVLAALELIYTEDSLWRGCEFEYVWGREEEVEAELKAYFASQR